MVFESIGFQVAANVVTMTTQDQNKKTLRHFQCRDYLWDIFEQMSGELECSTDYLINEAMRQYARSRNYGTNRRDVDNDAPTLAPSAPQPSAASSAIPSLRASLPSRPSMPAAPPRPGRPSMPAASSAMGQHTAPPLPRASAVSRPPPPRPASQSAQRAASVPPPLPTPPPQRLTLYAIFNGQKMPVNKDEFIIGRGSKTADLTIKDGNISRRHAAVVFHNGAYYMKDLGSTNGIEYQGRRFDSKHIEEGDVFRVCDYEIRFTYQ
jgi:hypothetical protein